MVNGVRQSRLSVAIMARGITKMWRLARDDEYGGVSL